jgi:hypothetical protein
LRHEKCDIFVMFKKYTSWLVMIGSTMCSFNDVLRILVWCIVLFLSLSLIGSFISLGSYHTYYNTSLDCDLENVTNCFNPRNAMVVQWTTIGSLIVVAVALSLFILYHVIRHYKKKWGFESYASAALEDTSIHSYDRVVHDYDPNSVGGGEGGIPFDSLSGDSSTDDQTDDERKNK